MAALPKVAALVAVFDLWICNFDRHDENLAFRKRSGLPAELLAFDHDKALFGERGTEGLLALSGSSTVRGCIAEVLTDPEDLAESAAALADTGRRRIRHAAEPAAAAGLVTVDELYQLEEFLTERARLLPELVRKAVREGGFGAIRQTIL